MRIFPNFWMYPSLGFSVVLLLERGIGLRKTPFFVLPAYVYAVGQGTIGPIFFRFTCSLDPVWGVRISRCSGRAEGNSSTLAINRAYGVKHTQSPLVGAGRAVFNMLLALPQALDGVTERIDRPARVTYQHR